MFRITSYLILLISFATYSQTDSQHYFEKSKLLFEEKNYENALSTIDNALKTDSLNRDYLIHKINILYNFSKCNEAIEVFDKVYSIKNEVDDQLIVICCQLEDCRSIEKKEKTTLLLKTYIDKNLYQNNEIIIVLAQRLLEQQDYENAIVYYKEYVLLEPHDIEAIIDLTKIVYKFKSSNEAIKEISKGLENNKDNVQLLHYLASCYYNTKNYDKALEIQNQIMKLEYNSENIASRSKLYELLGRKKEAYEDNKAVINLVKCNTEYYLKVLQYEADNRLYENVIKHSNELIVCDSKTENTLLDGLYTSSFFCGNIEKGMFFLDKKISLIPDNFYPYYLKASILIEKNQFKDVLKYLDLASNVKDITTENLYQISVIKLSYYILIEDYKSVVNLWKLGGIKSLDNNLFFILDENFEKEKPEFKLDFNKTTGLINSTLTVPSKVVKLLENEYRLKLKREK
ncbi:tetratricopeptide repeat protein [Flavobacterium sp.]|uniref:tetratricopeptide repeat protein n=1 Tax=Flavobacterium sp. TaxID=239 RepID=UPI003D6A2F3A